MHETCESHLCSERAQFQKQWGSYIASRSSNRKAVDPSLLRPEDKTALGTIRRVKRSAHSLAVLVKRTNRDHFGSFGRLKALLQQQMNLSCLGHMQMQFSCCSDALKGDNYLCGAPHIHLRHQMPHDRLVLTFHEEQVQFERS